ncbi:MAG: hypothetical protein ACREB8_11090 [Pseudolabrys sp.]
MSIRRRGHGHAAQRAVLLAAMAVTAARARAADAVADAEALAIVHKHCVMCHAVKPTHEAFQEAPNGVVLETVAELKKYSALIYAQTIQNKAMPMGNQTGMTEVERAALGRWLKASP